MNEQLASGNPSSADEGQGDRPMGTSENGTTSVDDGDDIDNTSNGRVLDGNGAGMRPTSHFMEGYTPLNFNMNALVMINGSDNDSDGESNSSGDMNGEVFANNGYYHMMGPPPRRLNGVKDRVLGFSMPHDHEEDDVSSHSDGSGSGIDTSLGNRIAIDSSPDAVEIPDDFHLLAEQALRGLEVEHQSTLERSVDAVAAPGGNSQEPNEGVNAPVHSTEFEACFPSLDEKDDTTNTQPDELIAEVSADTANEESTTKRSEPLAVSMTQPLKSKPMDFGAIQKAMQSIRLKSPQLAHTLDAGASSSFSTSAANVATDTALNDIMRSTSQAIERSQQQQVVSHAIIPSGPLAAFRRATTKAQTASSNLTRSATLSEAVLRLWPLICFRRRMRAIGLGGPSQQQANNDGTKALTIHILGADGVECSSEELVRKSVGSFVRWIDAALRSGALSNNVQGDRIAGGKPAQTQPDEIDSLLIEFSGPNMPGALIGKVMDLLPQSESQSGGLVSAKAFFQQREYHEDPSFADGVDIDGLDAPADVAIAFNAGVWGYDSWKPTIACMCDTKDDTGADNINSGIGKTLFVITAYTVEECEDDAEVVAEVVKDVAKKRSSSPLAVARQLWAPETNPFSSRLERKTASAPPGRKYYENGAWQAWLLGS